MTDTEARDCVEQFIAGECDEVATGR
jgi:hypothetical protein